MTMDGLQPAFDEDDTECTEDADYGTKMYGYGPSSPIASKRSRKVDYSGGDEDGDLQSVHSARSVRSRRNSVSSTASSVLIKDHCGYGDDGDSDSAEEEELDRMSKARSMRRASLKASRRASASGFRDYKPRTVSAPLDAMVPKSQRRASTSGLVAFDPSYRPRSGEPNAPSRRASLSGAFNGHAVNNGRANRRGSLTRKAAESPSTPPQRVVRLTQNSRGINQDAVRRMTRRMSSGHSNQMFDEPDSPGADGYGYGVYGYDAQSISRASHLNRRMSSSSKASRRDSNASRASNRHRRKSSHAQDPLLMSEVISGHDKVPESDLEDSESEMSSRYGYGNAGNSVSQGSRRSGRSRRNSCVIRNGVDTVIMTEIAGGPARVPDSDLEDSTDERSAYGYGQQNKVDYGSDATGGSTRSRRSARRNSTIIRPDANPLAMAMAPSHAPAAESRYLGANRSTALNKSVASLGESTDDGMLAYVNGLQDTGPGNDSETDRSEDVSLFSHKRSKRRNSCLNDAIGGGSSSLLQPNTTTTPGFSNDLDDPDSLLSRSGFFANKTIIDDEEPVNEHEECAAIPGGASPRRNTRLPINSNGALQKTADSSWQRKTPFTTSYSAPFEDQLLGSKKPTTSATQSHGLKHSLHSNWGELDIESESAKSRTDSEASFGASMYEESKTYQEIDRYKQRARRRASIDAGFINIQELLECPEKEGRFRKIKVPTFQPAEGCTNASDFIVRCFCARLRKGITVLKHNRSRFSKSQYRVLYLNPDGKSLSWKPVDGEKDKGKRPLLDLSMCKEVRHAWSKDPETRRQQGTSVIRAKCKENMQAKSLSLVFEKRTFDMTAPSTDLCKVLLEGFSALSFRLQLQRTGMEEGSSRSMRSTALEMVDDWASTIYGTESVSMTITTNTGNPAPAVPVSPWGL